MDGRIRFESDHRGGPGRSCLQKRSISFIDRSLDTDRDETNRLGTDPRRSENEARLNSFVRGEFPRTFTEPLARVLRAAICRTRAVSCCSSYHTDDDGAPAHDEPGTRPQFRSPMFARESRTTRSALAALPATDQQTRERVGRQLVVRV